MEVHHHSHIPASREKKWAHYFWEFLMLFLAVFCGFLAENWREHYVEHQREKQFVKQVLTDLRTDSVFFVKRMASVNSILEKHQQFYQLMTGPVKPADKEVIRACLPLLYAFDLQVTTSTYNQMKASGSLRYIQNEKIRTTLQQYYEILLPRISNSLDMEIRYYSDNLNPFILKHFRVQDFDYVSDTVKATNPVIMNRTNQLDQELLNIIEGYAGFHRTIQERLTVPAVKKLNELIGLVKKDYHLK